MNYAVIFAGGIGSRMQAKKGVPKQFLELHGKPIIQYTMEYFENCADIDGIVVACVTEWIDHLKKVVKKAGFEKVMGIVPGGASSQESVYHGISMIRDSRGADEDAVVLLHDGVRPLIDEELISNVIKCVREHGSAVTIVPATETIVKVDDSGMIKDTIERQDCRLARAPQGFFLEQLFACHEKAIAEGKRHQYIDSASMMLANGYSLYTVEGSPDNIKITPPSDFYVFRSVMDARENQQIWGL